MRQYLNPVKRIIGAFLMCVFFTVVFKFICLPTHRTLFIIVLALFCMAFFMVICSSLSDHFRFKKTLERFCQEGRLQELENDFEAAASFMDDKFRLGDRYLFLKGSSFFVPRGDITALALKKVSYVRGSSIDLTALISGKEIVLCEVRPRHIKSGELEWTINVMCDMLPSITYKGYIQ